MENLILRMNLNYSFRLLPKGGRNTMSLLGDIIKEIRRLVEAIRGKWSFESWMDMVGDFTDDLIQRKEFEEGLRYIKGSCTIYCISSNAVNLLIEMYFKTQDSKVVKYEAQRNFSKNQFLSDSWEKIQSLDKEYYPVYKSSNLSDQR